MADIIDGVGNAGADELYGTAEDDRMQGLDGNDEIYGAGGSDTIEGGIGNDWIYGGDGFFNDLYGGEGNDEIYADGPGNGANITSIADAVANNLDGGDGNDLLIDTGGLDDTLRGGSGADTFQLSDGTSATIMDFSVTDGDVLRLSASENFGEPIEDARGLYFVGDETRVYVVADPADFNAIVDQVEFF